jgi:hypothetical protein
MEVVKVRASAHEKDLRVFEITADGIVVGKPCGRTELALVRHPDELGFPCQRSVP